MRTYLLAAVFLGAICLTEAQVTMNGSAESSGAINLPPEKAARLGAERAAIDSAQSVLKALAAQTNLASASLGTPQKPVAIVNPRATEAPVPRLNSHADRIVGENSHHDVNFAKDLYIAKAVDLTLSGKGRDHLRSSISAIIYQEPLSGRSVQLATVKHSKAHIVSPNKILFRDAFGGDVLIADVQYTHGYSSLEQDVIIRTKLPSPAEYGLDPRNVLLSVMTEFYDPPTPARSPEVPEADDTLIFDGMNIAQGNAFLLGASAHGIRVRKDWVQMQGNRWFLIESVPYSQVAEQLNKLPKLVPAGSSKGPKKTAGLEVPSEPRQSRMEMTLPVLPSQNSSLLAGGPVSESIFDFAGVVNHAGWVPEFLYSEETKSTFGANREKISILDEQLTLSTGGDERGFVLDYVISSSTHLLNIDFGSSSSQKSGGAAIQASDAGRWNGMPATSNGTLSPLVWSDGGVSSASVTVNNMPGAWGFNCCMSMSDPMYQDYIYPFSGTGTVTVNGLSAGSYDFYIYGHTPSSQGDSRFELINGSGTSLGQLNTGVADAFWGGNPPDWHEGSQYVVYHGVSVGSGQTVRINVLAGTGSDHGTQINGIQIAPASNTPPTDQGDSRATSSQISPNSTISGEINPAGDVDYFKIYLSSDGTLVASTTGGTDTKGELQNSDGTILAYDDDSGVNGGFRISYNLAQGTYFIKVSHCSSSGTGPYSLSATFSVQTGDQGNSIATAAAISPNSVISAEISPAGDEDFFRVTIPTGSEGTLTASTSGGVDTHGYLLDASGNTLIEDEDSNGSFGFRFSYHVSPGNYYVRVRHHSSSGVGSYTLAVNHAFCPLPSFVDELLDASPYYGAPATFNSYASGSPNYQWQFSPDPSTTPFTDIPGDSAKNYWYNIPVVLPANKGSYRVIAQSSCGSVSRTVALNPLTPPQPDIDSVYCTGGVILGQRADFSVTAHSSVGVPLTYQWYHNGSQVSGATASSFNIPNVAASDSGNYTVEVDQIAGPSRTSSPVSLDVTPQPWTYFLAGFHYTESRDNDSWHPWANLLWNHPLLLPPGTSPIGEGHYGQTDLEQNENGDWISVYENYDYDVLPQPAGTSWLIPPISDVRLHFSSDDPNYSLDPDEYFQHTTAEAVSWMAWHWPSAWGQVVPLARWYWWYEPSAWYWNISSAMTLRTGGAPGDGGHRTFCITAKAKFYTYDPSANSGSGDWIAHIPGDLSDPLAASAYISIQPGWGVASQPLDGNSQAYFNLNDGNDYDITPVVHLSDGTVAPCYTYAIDSVTVPFELGIDANGNGGIGPDDDLLKNQGSGGVILVNGGDEDRDGVPNWADFQSDPNSSATSFGNFYLLHVSIPPGTDRKNLKLRFTYDGSDPTASSLAADPPVLPANGKIRLWKKAAIPSRDPASDFVMPTPEVVYSLTDFGFRVDQVKNPSADLSFNVLVEAVRSSSTSGDIQVTVGCDPNGTGTFLDNQVKFTAIGVGLVEATKPRVVEGRTAFKDSDASPVITVDRCVASNVRASSDGTKILADLDISGTVNSSVCDITPGDPAGAIQNVSIFLNSYENLLNGTDVPLAVSKSIDPTSFVAPYAYLGTFTKSYTGVEVDAGTNLVRITATDPVIGNTGFIELTFAVSATDLLTFPLVDPANLSYEHADASLDFGGIASSTDLTPSHPVTLTAQSGIAGVPTVTATLYRVSADGVSPVILSSQGSADKTWVVIPSATELNDALNSTDIKSFTAAVSASSILPLNTQFSMRKAAVGSTMFQHDQISASGDLASLPTGSSVDQIQVSLSRRGFSEQNNVVLTETAQDSLTFANDDSSIQVKLEMGSSSGTGNYIKSLAITSTALEVANDSPWLPVITTGSGSISLNTWQPVEVVNTDRGWNFGWSFDVGPCKQIARSEGGELHLHYLQFQGPLDVLEQLTHKPLSTVIKGSDNQYYFKRPGEDRPADYATSAAAPSDTSGDLFPFGPRSGTAAFYLGFGEGFTTGGWTMLKGMVSGVKNASGWAYNLYFGTDKQQADAYQTSVGFARGAADTVKVLGNFVLKVHEDEDTFWAAVLHGQFADANKIAAPYQLAVEYTAEFIKETWNEYLTTGDDREHGQIFGRIMFEVASVAISYCRAGEVIEASKVGKLGFLCKLRESDFYTRFPKAGTALENVIQKLETIGLVDGCFIAGTVVTAEQGKKFIEEIRPGDRVLSRDSDSGEQSYRSVTKVLTNSASRLYYLTYRVSEAIGAELLTSYRETGVDENRDGVLVATGVHPIYVCSLNRFVPVSDLRVGDILQCGDGRHAELISSSYQDAPAGKPFRTYNLAVADFHSYFVGVPGIWVHNTCPIRYERTVSRMESHAAKLSEAGTTPWDAGVAANAANKSAHFPAARGRLFVGVTRQGLENVAAGRQELFIGGDLNKMTIPTHDISKSVYAEHSGMKGLSPIDRLPSYYSDHHVVFAEIIEILNENKLLKPGFGTGSSPSALLDWAADHDPMHDVMGPMLKELKKSKGGKQNITVDDAIKVFNDGYKHQDVAQPNMAKVAEMWLNSVRK